MPAPLPWSPKLRDELLRRRAAGATIDELLAWLHSHGCKASRSGLWQRLRAEGASPVYKIPNPPPPPPPPPTRQEKSLRTKAILAALKAGVTQQQAAKCFGVTKQRVWTIARKARLASVRAKATLSQSCENLDASPPPPLDDGCSSEGSHPSSLPT